MQAIVSSIALNEPENCLKKLSAPRLDNLKLNQLNLAPISPIALASDRTRSERPQMQQQAAIGLTLSFGQGLLDTLFQCQAPRVNPDEAFLLTIV